MTTEKTQINLIVPARVRAGMKMLALRRGITMKQLIIEIFEAEIKKMERS